MNFKELNLIEVPSKFAITKRNTNMPINKIILEPEPYFTI